MLILTRARQVRDSLTRAADVRERPADRGNNDLSIGAHAMALDVALATNNERVQTDSWTIRRELDEIVVAPSDLLYRRGRNIGLVRGEGIVVAIVDSDKILVMRCDSQAAHVWAVAASCYTTGRRKTARASILEQTDRIPA
jgi:hypothetical protein